MKFKIFLIPIITFLSTSLYGQANRLDILKEFGSTHDDSLFVMKYSKMPYQKFILQRLTFPQPFSPLDSIIFYSGSEGKIIGPVYLDSIEVLIKITSVDSFFRMRVGNIWMSPEKRGADKIDELAENIIKTVIRTGDFDALRKEFSDDFNNNYDADLGWFFQGMMVKEFEDEVLKHRKGDYFIASSRFGKHVVKIIENPILDRSKVEYVLLYLDKK